MTYWKPLMLSIRLSGRHPGVRVGIIASMICLVLMLGSLAFWLPAFMTNTGLVSDVQQQRDIISQYEYNKKFSSLYARSKRTFQSINNKLNAKHSQSAHVKQLDKMLRSRQIKVLNEVYDSEKTAAGYTRLSQELSLQGNYGELRKFMIELNRLPSWTIVQELRIEKQHTYSGMIKAVLKLVTYYAEA